MTSADDLRSRVRPAVVVAVVVFLAAGCGDTDGRQGVPAPAREWTVLTWTCEDQDARGRPIGPVIVSDATDAEDFDSQWHTRGEARAIARRLHARYTEDC